MIRNILELDTRLFLFLNGMHHPVMDQVMWFFSRISVWIPLYVLLVAWIIHTFRKRAWVIISLAILLIVCSDQTSVHLFKNIFLRLRPSHNPSLEGMIHLVNQYKGGLYGFVSSHAANTYAFTVYIAFLYGRRWWTIALLVWAAVVSYSRIYLGVHYPGDVLCGALWGSLLAWLFYLLTRYTLKKYFPGKSYKHADH